MIDQLLSNWLCWAIVMVAFASYQQLLMNYLSLRAVRTHELQPAHAQHNNDETVQREFSGVLINALPLMGLLGTIIGLLDCFVGIANEGASGELVSRGIADALLTTQLGLICAIPGWLLQAWVRSRSANPSRDKTALMSYRS